MTTPTTRELVADRREQYAFHDDIVYLRETGRGLSRETVEEISQIKGEPEWMLALRLRAFEHFQKRPMPIWTEGLDRIDFDKIVYYRKPSEREEKSWDDVPDKIKATFEKLGIPEAERKFLAGVGRPVRLGGRVPLRPRGAHQDRRRVHGHGPGPEGARGHRPEVVRDGRAGGGQQVLGAQHRRLVGRLVRLRPEGRRGAAAAAGLLPDQRREHRPVRADPDRRRRGREGPLHRGLHRADLRDRLAPRRRGRGRRAARLEGSLHDHPELVERRLQPRDQAGPRVRALDGRVGRRQHRVSQDRQVPEHLPARRGRAGRGDLRRGRRQGPAPGHRRQGHPPRAEHDLPDRLEVGLEGRRPRDLPRPPQGLARRDRGRRLAFAATR